jgi:hypothetical protein
MSPCAAVATSREGHRHHGCAGRAGLSSISRFARASNDGGTSSPSAFAVLRLITNRHRIPAIYPFREDTAAGGLMSYGASNRTAEIVGIAEATVKTRMLYGRKNLVDLVKSA